MHVACSVRWYTVLVQVGMETMMHLTCTNMPVEKLEEALEKVHGAAPYVLSHAVHAQAKASGVRNILALRGDPPKGEASFKQVEGGFGCALDLVKFIRCCTARHPHCRTNV